MDKAAVDAAVSALESSIHTIDFWALLCGIGVAIFLAGEIWFIGAHWLKESTLRPLRERQSQLTELEIANAKKATEELRNENFKLQQQAANRDITPQEVDTATSKLARFAGQQAKIVLFPVNFESNWIAGQVYGILLNSKWKIDPPIQLPAPPNGFMVQGIWVDRSNDSASKNAAKALREALNSTVAQASGVGDDGDSLMARIGEFDPSKPMVWIMVGDKPTPLRSWVKP